MHSWPRVGVRTTSTLTGNLEIDQSAVSDAACRDDRDYRSVTFDLDESAQLTLTLSDDGS